MSTKVTLQSWPRAYYQPGGGHPQLFYKVHGHLAGGVKLERLKYRCAGVPEGVEVSILGREDGADAFTFGFDGPFADRLAAEAPEVMAAALEAPQCLVMRGVIEDPSTLDYLRDVVGFLTCLLDQGGVAIFDPFRLDWWTPGEWKQKVFEPAGPEPFAHVVILTSEDERNEGKYWFHTRGLIKFGRPDISIRGVTEDLIGPAEDVCNRFIQLMANGGMVPDGQPLKMASWPTGWACFHGGDLDDPDFNNVHVEVRQV